MNKVLVVEDEEILAEMYKKKLSNSGFYVLWASTAREAFVVTKKENPNLILLDILLPDENGISLLEKIRLTPETSSAKVIVFSNFDDPELREKAKKLKAEDYLIKTDITPDKIIEKIRLCLKEN